MTEEVDPRVAAVIAVLLIVVFVWKIRRSLAGRLGFKEEVSDD